MHDPGVMMVTDVPFTVHTDAVCDVNATGKPEVAVALTGNGVSPYVFVDNALNVIV